MKKEKKITLSEKLDYLQKSGLYIKVEELLKLGIEDSYNLVKEREIKTQVQF